MDPVNIRNIQGNVLVLSVLLQGGGSSRTVTIPAFGSAPITAGEYTQNPDYYNTLVTQGVISMDSPNILFNVNDEPLYGQIGSAH